MNIEDIQLSLILVSCNSAAYLPRCFERLAAQTLQNFEIILIDNGSNDLAALDAQALSRQFDLYIERLPSNLGFAAANNIGARLARRKWLALLDADAL